MSRAGPLSPRPLWLWPLGLLAVTLAADPARAQGQTFTPHHVAKLRTVLSAAVSPDGAQVAYVLAVPRDLPKQKDGGAWTELHVVDAKGNSRPFVIGEVNLDAVQWTPDGKAISFLARRGTDSLRALYRIPLAGGEARKILSHGADIQGYSWSPDGKRVAFLAPEPAPKKERDLQELGFNQEIYEEELRPVRVWVAEPGGEKPPTALKLKGSASELHWAPEQGVLALALAPSPKIDEHYMFRKAHVVAADGEETINLKNPGKMGQLSWSPDAKHLALIAAESRHDPREGRLWVTSERKDGWTDLLPDYKGHVEAVGWKDAETLVYVGAEGVWTALGTVQIGYEDGKRVARERKTLVPAGGPILRHMTASKDGKALAFVADTPQHPQEVYLLGPGDKAPRRLTDSNPWLKKLRLAKQEVVQHKARDGLELEGILVRPLDEKPGRRYPLVLTVHGGPEAHVANGWTTLYHGLGQVGAARGMAVFYPNYRGSTGRGVAFSEMGQRDAAGKEFDDLVDAVDHLVKTGLVDAKKVGVTGGSYGGYATAWCSTYFTDRFAAGVMFVGISDGVSKVGTTDIPYEMYLVHHRKWLWEDWDYFLKRSPIYHVEKARTPLLILHGKADPRVHPGQSLELYRHLKVLGKTSVRLVLYPGEGHGNRRAASRLDYNLRLLQWMEHYLKGPGGAPPPARLDYGLPAKAAGASGKG
jgi:dipeptidyl aminopeptidase/acylaminoacyl peptidase